MILRVHLGGARDYDIGDEIWQQSPEEAITAEAETIAGYTGPALLGSPDQPRRDALRDRLIAEMNSALVDVGDEYQAPDGIRYSLVGDAARGAGTLGFVAPDAAEPVVEEVLRFEDVPLGSTGSRRVIVRWSDGTEGEAVRFYADEVLFSEGDVLGKTRSQLGSLHFRRDRDWLQSS